MFSPPPPPHVGQEHETTVRLGDWLELNLLMQEVTTLSIDDVNAELAGGPPDNADDAEDRSDLGYWGNATQSTQAAFAELRGRATWLRNQYPIVIDGDTAQLAQGAVTQEIYGFLVLLRARQMYDSSIDDGGGKSGWLFEELVKYALGAYADSGPEHQVRFGVAGGARGDGLPQSLAGAVNELRDRMHERPGEVPNSGQGDYKADAIAWKPFGDGLPGQLVLIGQATISEGDWISDEPAPRWTVRTPPERRLVNWLARPMTAVAFPETLSLTPLTVLDGLTFQSIPLDRLRLLSVLCDHDLPTELRGQMQLWVENTKHGIPK